MGRTGKMRHSLSVMAKHGLWPTPTARLGNGRGMPSPELAARRYYDESRRNLDDAVALWPTPTVSRATYQVSRGQVYPTLPGSVSGPLNPTWVEWLMGFPPGWTGYEPSATP